MTKPVVLDVPTVMTVSWSVTSSTVPMARTTLPAGRGTVWSTVKVVTCAPLVTVSGTLVARLGNSAVPPPLFLPCDLRDADAIAAMMAQVEAQLGGIDVVINNAANDDRHAVAEVSPAYWDERMAVNLKHQFFVTQAAVPAMKRAGGGAVINLGSISWHLGLPDLVIYQTAKAAIEGLTRGLARELGRDNIRVTAIIPGNVKTPRQEQWYTPEGEAEIVASQCLDGRLVPADVAALALFLASDDARLITGHEYWVDAGWR